MVGKVYSSLAVVREAKAKEVCNEQNCSLWRVVTFIKQQ
jgi:hypothetical protein